MCQDEEMLLCGKSREHESAARASGRVNGEKERGSSGRRECGQTADQGEHGGHAPGRLTKRGEKCANYMPEM